VSTLVAVSLETHERLWQAALTDVSHTGVLVAGDVAVVGADDGHVSAFAVSDGAQRWSVDAGDHVLAPIAASSDLVVASVRPDTSRGAPLVLALHLADGTEAWRYTPPSSVLDLGAPSIAGEAVDVVASDASVRSLSLADGSQRWASPLYTPTLGSPPVVSDAGLFVTDQSGTVYCLDPSTGDERWRFATNHSVVGAPIATSTAVLQPTNDGSVIAIDAASGHQIWHATVTDDVVFGLAASPDLIVATHTGSAPGFVALANDPAGVTEDLASPTTADPAGLALGWLVAAVPLVVLLVLLGRTLDRRMGPAALGAAPDDVVDPWESELEDDT
jgi:outer membrane protein assembly factor BamB